MKIGRLSIEMAPADANWGKKFYSFSAEKATCGCVIVDASIFSFTWFDKKCKCRFCDQNVCICTCPSCGLLFSNCNCGLDAA